MKLDFMLKEMYKQCLQQQGYPLVGGGQPGASTAAHDVWGFPESQLEGTHPSKKDVLGGEIYQLGHSLPCHLMLPFRFLSYIYVSYIYINYNISNIYMYMESSTEKVAFMNGPES